MTQKHFLIKITIILILISYNVYSQTFCEKINPYSDENYNIAILVYNKTNNTLRIYALDDYSFLISDFKTDVKIVCVEFIIKNNKAVYNKQFEYSIYNDDITINYINNEDMKNHINDKNNFVASDVAHYLYLLDLLLIADTVSISDKKIEIIYKNYKRTIKPLIEEKNKVSSPLWYFFLKEKLAKIN